MAAKVVHDDDGAGPQRGGQNPLNPGLEDAAVDRAVDDERRDNARAAQCGDESGGFPMSVRHTHAQALAAQTATVTTGHIGAGPAFIDEDELRRVEFELPSNQASRRLRTSGRSCLAACGVFFCVAGAGKEPPLRAVVEAQALLGLLCAQFLQRHLAVRVERRQDSGGVRVDHMGFEVAAERTGPALAA